MGLTQVELARKARIASTNLCAIENGRLATWPKVEIALVRVLKTSSEELFPNEYWKHGNDNSRSR